MTVDNILLPELYNKKKKRRRKLKHSGKGFIKFLPTLFVVLIISGALFSFSDIGGNIALSIAKNFLAKNYSIALNAEKISGNPIRGYTLHNFGLTDQTSSRDIFSAGFLSARLNLPALITGNLRLAEISLGRISMDVDHFIASIQSLKLPPAPENHEVSGVFSASPAFADDDTGMPNIPLDNFSIVDSRFSSKLGVFDVHEIGADIVNLEVSIDGAINSLPLRGTMDMESLTSANRSELYLGTGKIIATGGVNGGKLDIHMSAEDFNLKEVASLYPSILRVEDFDGKADLIADLSGTTEKPSFKGAFEYWGTKVYGYPVERASANISYSGNRVSVSNIQASAFNVPVQGEISAAFKPGKKVSVLVKLDGSEAYLNDLDKILGFPELKALTGKVSLFNVNISGHVDELSGLVNFTAPKIAYDGRTLTNIRAQMKLLRSNTANVDGKFTFEGASGYLSGNVASLLTTPAMNITAKIADLDIKRVENMIPDAPQYKLGGKITASITVKGSASNPHITGEISSPEFHGWEQTIMKPAINFVFSDKTLILSKTQGTLNGTPINLTGKITPLPSENPKLDINATITMTPSALKAYVPDIDSYGLKGTVNAGLKIGGDMNNPSVRLLATSPNLQAMDMVTAKNLELTTALNGDLTKLEKISVNIAAKSITSGGITLTGANANVSKNGDKITLAGLNVKSGSGTITGSGTASISGKSPLDFSFMFKDLAIESLASSSGLDVKGKLSGTLKVSGQNENPSLTFSAKVPALNALGFVMNNVSANMAGNMKGNFSCKGSITAASLAAFGLKLSDVNLPLTYSGNNFALNGGSAKLYGGTLKNTLTLNTGTMKFTDDISAEDVDVNGLIQDASGGLEGKISGKGKLTFRVTGSAKDKVSYSGTGNFSIGQGAITGFKWLDIFTRILKSDGLRYSSVKAPMTLQTGRLLIKSGAIASAMDNNALYKYTKLTKDGIIDFSGEKMTMDFMTESSINYQLVNAIQGGAKGGIEALLKGGVSGFRDNVTAFLKGVSTEANNSSSTGDFRTITLRIHGKADSLSFSELNIGQSSNKSAEKSSSSVQVQAAPKPQKTQTKDLKQAVKGKITEKAKEVLPDELKKVLKIDSPAAGGIIRIFGTGKKD